MNRQQNPRRNAEEWQEIISNQEASGESVSVYCRKYNLCDKSFYTWRRRLERNTDTKLKDFIEMTVPAQSNKEVLRIKTPQGYCLEVPEGTESTFVKNMISMLESK